MTRSRRRPHPSPEPKEEEEEEETIRVVPSAGRRPRAHLWPLIGVPLALMIGAPAAWLALRPSPPAAIAPPAVQAPPVAPLHVLDVPNADEAAILAAPPRALEVFRFARMPHVLALPFPSLREQGRMLNRIGAFVEKADMPHDRVLGDAEFGDAIRRAGETEDTYYYGHDYRAADLARFFAVAAREGLALRPEEERLRALLETEGMLAPGAVGAIISIPPESETPPIDAAARATILHHELSHGLYFTDPAYAAYVRAFWRTTLTEAQRAGFRRFLGSQGYDPANEDLMMNETAAYLVHTPDPRYFRPDLAGLTDAEADALRHTFARDMPESWLRQAMRTRFP